MRVLLVFIDGLGLGEANPEKNPLFRFQSSFFRTDMPPAVGQVVCRKWQGKSYFLIPTDAALDVPGLPQSATGQTAIFTGVNAAKAVGHHVQAFPGPQLIKIITEQGILTQLRQKGFQVTSANVYTSNYLELVAQRKRRHSVTTQVILTGGLPLRSLPEILCGRAVSQDLTNEMLPQFGVRGVPVISAAKAAARLIRIASEQHFTMFEYFQTDFCGHARDWMRAEQIAGLLEEFIGALFSLAAEDMLILVTNDHGNFEDFSVKTHTLNLVPTLAFGSQAEEASRRIRSLTDITPVIVSILERNEPGDSR
ncbi:metalloenzyme [Acetonema longum]|uniref:Metalloenzyme domain protein n=1 Tax=Acetonema longum DSM 6540 TaxID=1009370 RepID=F7NNF1_9FIRM|nr:metalloenzyme [Acetonema longum]EGO62392.1 metalloenzyme domain protein [Acetonema longum DSM 6540]